MIFLKHNYLLFNFKNKTTYLFLFLFFFTHLVFSQKQYFDIATKYSTKQVLKDIDYTEKYLIKFHPDPFKYITKDSLHAFVIATKAKIDTPLTEMQMRFYLKQIVAKIGCGHSDVTSSKQYEKALRKINRPILPLNIFVVDSNKLIVLNNLSKDTTIKPGDEIISIDKRFASTILKRIYSIYTTDGYNTTYKKQGIKYDWFKYYYSFCFGFHRTYLIVIKNTKGAITQHTLEAISSAKDTLILPKKDSISCIQKTKNLNYYLLNKDTSVAVLDINSFHGPHWHKCMRRTFKDIKKREINNLVIDLRDNGGGKISEGLNMLSYLIHKPTTVGYDRKPNLLTFNHRFKMGFFTRITPILFSINPMQHFKNGKLRHYFYKAPKKRNAYYGNVFVLINGKSFSMSCIAASYLKYKANAVVIGEETGGNVVSSNAVVSGSLLLPNTKVRVYVPMYHIYYSIAIENNGRGVIPNYETNYTTENILKAQDVDLEKVLELVKNQKP